MGPESMLPEHMKAYVQGVCWVAGVRVLGARRVGGITRMRNAGVLEQHREYRGDHLSWWTFLAYTRSTIRMGITYGEGVWRVAGGRVGFMMSRSDQLQMSSTKVRVENLEPHRPRECLLNNLHD